MAQKTAPNSTGSDERSSEPVRRAGILDAAEKLFRHYGPLKTTIGDIAREAGIGVGSVYLEFCSKDDIVAELSGRRHQRVLSAMRAAAAQSMGVERLTAALEARIVALFELSAEGAHACDLVLCSAAPVKNAYGRFRSEELAFVASLLEEESRAGSMAVDDPRRIAELLQRAHATLTPPWLFELELGEALALGRALNRLLLSGLLVRPEATPPHRRSR